MKRVVTLVAIVATLIICIGIGVYARHQGNLINQHTQVLGSDLNPAGPNQDVATESIVVSMYVVDISEVEADTGAKQKLVKVAFQYTNISLADIRINPVFDFVGKDSQSITEMVRAGSTQYWDLQTLNFGGTLNQTLTTLVDTANDKMIYRVVYYGPTGTTAENLTASVYFELDL